MGASFFRKLKTNGLLLALGWVLPFAVQSVALSTHAAEHALKSSLTDCSSHAASDLQHSSAIQAVECGLCLAYQMTSHSLVGSMTALANPVTVQATVELPPAPVFVRSYSAPLARGPPALSA